MSEPDEHPKQEPSYLATTDPPRDLDRAGDVLGQPDAEHAFTPASGPAMAIPQKPRRRTYVSILPDGWDKPRPCRWCRARFIPKRPQDAKAGFCCKEHRIEFYQPWRRPTEKLMMQIEHKADREVEHRMKGINRRITKLEKSLKKMLDLRKESAIASNIEKSK